MYHKLPIIVMFFSIVLSYCKEKNERPPLNKSQIEQRQKVAKELIGIINMALGQADTSIEPSSMNELKNSQFVFTSKSVDFSLKYAEIYDSFEALEKFFALRPKQKFRINQDWRVFALDLSSAFVYAGNGIIKIERAQSSQVDVLDFAEKAIKAISPKITLPSLVENLPRNERWPGTLIFEKAYMLLGISVPNCVMANYRWASDGQLFICQNGGELAKQLVKRMATAKKVELDSRVAKRSQDNIRVRVLEVKDSDKTLYSIYQTGDLIYGIKGHLAKSLAKAIVNEISQSIKSKEKVSLNEQQ